MAGEDGCDAKQRAAQALRGLRKSTALPRPLQFLTGESVTVESSERRITERQLYHGKYADRE